VILNEGALAEVVWPESLTQIYDRKRERWDGGDGSGQRCRTPPTVSKGELVTVLGHEHLALEEGEPFNFRRILHHRHGVWWISKISIQEVIDEEGRSCSD
jgi:hypothetical protein